MGLALSAPHAVNLPHGASVCYFERTCAVAVDEAMWAVILVRVGPGCRRRAVHVGPTVIPSRSTANERDDARTAESC